MEKNWSWEGDGCFACEEISCLFWNAEIRCCVRMGQLLDPVTNWVIPVHILIPYEGVSKVFRAESIKK